MMHRCFVGDSAGLSLSVVRLVRQCTNTTPTAVLIGRFTDTSCDFELHNRFSAFDFAFDIDKEAILRHRKALRAASIARVRAMRAEPVPRPVVARIVGADIRRLIPRRV